MGKPRFYSRLGLAAIVLLMYCPPSHTNGIPRTGKEKSPASVETNDTYAIYLINNFLDITGNDGDGSYNPRIGSSGGEFPKGGNVYAIFEDGLVWGGKQNGLLKVGGSTYRHGLQAGRIMVQGIGGAGAIADDPSQAKYHVYRVRPDINPGTQFAQVQDKLIAETATLPPLFTPTAQQLYDQYVSDWNSWPAADGAPFVDKNGNGVYDPSVDVPGIIGADQTLWYVANDLDASRTISLHGSQPLGIEFQRTVWGYNSVGPLGNVMISSYRLINKSGASIDSMYVTQWSDPDIGDAGDDFVGCDTTLSLGYAYNGQDYDTQYGLQPPAVGYVFLKGPAVPGAPTDTGFVDLFTARRGIKNLRMSSFNFFINSNPTYFDPVLGDYSGTIQWYNLMKGMVGSTGAPYINPVTGRPTKYVLSGDPVTGTGWIDGSIAGPADRRMALTSGPFSMAAGDTQVVATALVGAGGGTRFQNISSLRGLILGVRSLLSGGIEIAVTQPKALYPLGAIVPLTGSTKMLIRTLQPVWFIASKPIGSSAQIVQVDPFDVNVVTDIVGHYRIGFTSIPSLDTVFASFDVSPDRAPVANFNAPSEITLGDTVKMDGTVSSDPDNDPLTYQWKVTGGSSGAYEFNSADTLSGVLIGGLNATAAYVPDRMSKLTIQLTASDALFSTTIVKNVRVNPMKSSNISFGKVFPLSSYFQSGIFGSVQVREFDSDIWANALGSLAVLDFGPSTSPTTWYPVGAGRFVVPNDRLIVVANSYAGAQVVTTNGAGSITNVVYLDPDNSLISKPDTTAWDVYFQNPYLFFSYGLPGLYVYGLSAPGIPSFVSVYNNGEEWRNFVVSGYTLFALHPLTKNLSVVDISNPYTIAPLAKVHLNRTFTALRLSGHYLYLAKTDTVAIFDISSASSPTLVNEFAVPKKYRTYNALNDLAVADDRLVLSTTEGCYMYDVSNPSFPTQIAQMITGIPMTTSFYDGTRIVVSVWDRFGTESTDRPGGAVELVYSGPSSVHSDIAAIPRTMTLDQCYPNPFNPSTTISYALPGNGVVTLTVYDLLGREVTTLVNEQKKAGTYRVKFDGSKLSSGVYFYQLKAGNLSRVKKMLLLK